MPTRDQQIAWKIPSSAGLILAEIQVTEHGITWVGQAGVFQMQQQKWALLN